MKRSGPPKRKTSLKAKSGLRRKTPLRSKGKRMKRTRLKPGKGNPVPPSTRLALEERCGGRCEACDVAPLDVCDRRAQHPHHVDPKGMGGGNVDHSLTNLLAVSATHHRWIHEHPAESKRLGLLR